jgi:hypothetical protein
VSHCMCVACVPVTLDTNVTLAMRVIPCVIGFNACHKRHEDSVGFSVYLVYISAIRWPIYFCPTEKEGNSKWLEDVALEMSNFGIRYWRGD